jgi:DNA polymerase-3 subunit alpha/error-prone DNA polymerase
MQLEGLDSKQHRIVADRYEWRIPIAGKFHQSHSDRNRRDQILIFIGAFRFTKQKNQLLVIARLILVNYKPETGT